MSSPKGYPAFRNPPISNEASSINKFLDLRKRTNDLKARYLPRYMEFNATEYTQTSATWSDGPGPLFIPLSVKQGNFVAVYLEAEMCYDSGTSSTMCHLGLYEADEISATATVGSAGIATGAPNEWVTGIGVWNRVPSTLGVAGIQWPIGSWFVLAPPPGIHTYYLKTSVAAGGQYSIRNRRIWGMLL